MSFRIVSKSIWGNRGNRGRRLSRTLSAVRWQLRKRLTGKPLDLRLASGRRFRAHADCVISSSLVYADYPEFEELRFIRSNLRKGDVLIDVGANVGHIGLLLNDLVDAVDVFAFEPTPLTFSRLRENWELNESCGEPNLFQMAIGDEDGEVMIPDLSEPNTMNAIVDGDDAITNNTPMTPVKIARLDSLRDAWQGRSIGLLKIDVEGHEEAVFRGATELLTLDRPSLVMFESLTGRLSPVIRSVLSDAEYDVFQLKQEMPDFDHLDAQNLFACPRHRRENLLHRTY